MNSYKLDQAKYINALDGLGFKTEAIIQPIESDEWK